MGGARSSLTPPCRAVIYQLIPSVNTDGRRELSREAGGPVAAHVSGSVMIGDRDAAVAALRDVARNSARALVRAPTLIAAANFGGLGTHTSALLSRPMAITDLILLNTKAAVCQEILELGLKAAIVEAVSGSLGN